jgi:hypothetical protein
MKKILFVVFLTVACAAKAQNTAQAWEFRRSQCQNITDQTATAYDLKAQGNQFYKAFRPNAGDNGKLTVFSQWAFEFATTTKIDRDGVLRQIFTKCIDNIDRIYRDDGNTPVEQFR